MNTTVNFICPVCNKRNHIKYNVSENFCDCGGCGECGAEFSNEQSGAIYEKVMKQAWDNVASNSDYWRDQWREE